MSGIQHCYDGGDRQWEREYCNIPVVCTSCNWFI